MMFGALPSPRDPGFLINPCCCHLWGKKASAWCCWATVGGGGAESVGMSLLSLGRKQVNAGLWDLGLSGKAICP